MSAPMYVWKGQYGCNTTYFLNDVVKHEGQYYVAAWDSEQGIPWNIFPNDELFWSKATQEIVDTVVPPPPNPDLLPYVWRGDYACETTYHFHNVVRHEGRLYVAIYTDANGIPWNQFPGATDYWVEADLDVVGSVVPAPFGNAPAEVSPEEREEEPEEESPVNDTAPPEKSMDGWVERPTSEVVTEIPVEQPVKQQKLYSLSVTHPDGSTEKISAIAVTIIDLDNTLQIELR